MRTPRPNSPVAPRNRRARIFLPLLCEAEDLSRLESGERNPAEARGPRGPSERERASHWAGERRSPGFRGKYHSMFDVRCSMFDVPGLVRKIIWWPLIISVVILCASLPAQAFGQSANRWLLIFETTSSMRNRTNGLLNEVQDLVSTGMHGTIHPGDTIGIWTFNDKLHAGEAPLQWWWPEESNTIIRHTLKFVSAQPYAGSARMNEMLTNMLSIVDASPFITVILFTDGNDPVKGTPFDSQINQFFKTNYRHQKSAAMPVITVLRGVKGELTTNTLNAAPWPVDIPFVPSPPPKPAAAAKPAPPATPPIIYVGKPETSAPAPAAPAEQNNAAPMSAPSAPATPSNTVKSNTVAPKAEAPAPPMTSAPAPLAEPPADGTTDATPAPQPTESAETARTTATNGSASAATPAALATTEAGTTKPSNAPSDAVATGASQENIFSARNIAIFSVAFAVIVCGLLIMSARRARASQSSLITRSLDRERR